MQRKTGLFFGSFNPIHTGHLLVAEYMLEALNLEKVLFVVSPQNPFKQSNQLWPESFRLELCKLAVQDNPHFEVSEIEFDLSRPSYTINTLNHLKQLNPGVQYSIIMGADNLKDLHQWKDIESILASYHVEVYERPGYIHPAIDSNKITIHKTPLIDISASYVRNRLKQGKSVKYLVPDLVEKRLQEYFENLKESETKINPQPNKD